MTFGDKVKEARLSLNLSQAELAKSIFATCAIS